MLFTLLLVAALSGTPQDQGATTGQTANATQLEDAGRFEEALSVLERQVAGNPNDHRARLAIARLQERLGHSDRAEAVYRSVMLEDGTNVDAMLGVGRTLLSQGAVDDAIDVLLQAEQVSARRADVVATLGRAYRQAGDTSRALPYLELAAAASPTTDNRLQLEAARREYWHRVESQSFAEEFSGTGTNARATDLSINVRLTNTLRVVGRGQVHRKFGTTDTRGGGGLEWRWTPSTTLTGQAVIGSGNTVLAEGDYLGEIRYTQDPVTWTGSVRFFDFPGVEMTVLSPGLAWRASERFSVELGYWLSMTDRRNADTANGHSARLRGAYALGPRIWFNLGYASGVDSFENLSVDRVGAFHAHTGLAGMRVELPSLTSVVTTFEYQSRKSGPHTQRLSLLLAQRF